MRLWCHCQCHAPDDEERDEASRFVGVAMHDEVAMHTAPASCCRSDHWKTFYEATERKPRLAREKAPWVSSRGAQADGTRES